MNSVIQFLNEYGPTFCHHALWMLVQTGILVGLLWGLDRLLRIRVKATLRYAIWLLVLIKLVLPVDFSLPSGIGYWLRRKPTDATGSLEPAQPAQAVLVQPPVEKDVPAAADGSSVTIQPVVEEAVFETIIPSETMFPVLSVQGKLLLIWVLGVIVLSIASLVQYAMIRRMICCSRAVPEGVERLLSECKASLKIHDSVGIRQSDEINSPAVCGLFRPTVLIPSSLIDTLKPEQLETVLLHELGHIHRRDLWVNLIQNVLQLFYFYNPFVRLANHRIRRVREQANDEQVLVRLNGKRDHYSMTLVEVAAAAVGRPAFAVRLIGVAESKNQLHERITLMERKSIPTNTKMGLAGMSLLAILAAVLLPMAARPAVAGTETKSGIPVIGESEFLKASKNLTDAVLAGINKADAAAATAPYLDDAILLISQEPPKIGRQAITAAQEQTIMQGIKILSADTRFENVRVSGKYVFAADETIATVRTPQMQELLMVSIKGLTVWEIQPDGSLKFKVDAWNKNPTPSSEPVFKGTGFTMKPGAFHSSKDTRQTAAASSEILEGIRKLEKTFEQSFLGDDSAVPAGYYTENAILMVDQMDTLYGRKAIQSLITDSMKRYDIDSKDQEIISMEGTEDMVFVVNSFRSKVKETGQMGDYMSVYYKGVHVWQKQPDESWKIILDCNSPNDW